MAPHPAPSPWRALVGALAVLAGVVACSGIITGPDAPDLRPRSMRVTPSSLTVALGDTARVAVALFDVTGAPAVAEAGVPVTYVSSDTTVARVDSTGLVTGVGGGTASVRGVYGALSLGVPVQVTVRPRVVIVSGNAQTAEQGDTLPLPIVVRALDAAGQPVSGVTIDFVPDAGNGAVVPSSAQTDGAGLAQARWVLGTALGAQVVRAQRAGADSAVLTATATPGTRVRRVEVTAVRTSLTGIGDTTQLLARAYNVVDSLLPAAAFTWTSGDTTVLVVSPAGLVTSRAVGSAWVRATSGAFADSALLTVSPVVASGVLHWSGAVSSDWRVPANWVEGIAPTSTDSVVVPATGVSNLPVFDATTFRSLVSLNAQPIALDGDGPVRVTDALVLRTDVLAATCGVGAGFILRQPSTDGVFPLAGRMSCGVTVQAGDRVLVDSLVLEGKSLALEGTARLTLAGHPVHMDGEQLFVSGGARLEMLQASDRVHALFANLTAAGQGDMFTAGELHLRQGLGVVPGGGDFVANPDHRVVLTASAPGDTATLLVTTGVRLGSLDARLPTRIDGTLEIDGSVALGPQGALIGTLAPSFGLPERLRVAGDLVVAGGGTTSVRLVELGGALTATTFAPETLAFIGTGQRVPFDGSVSGLRNVRVSGTATAAVVPNQRRAIAGDLVIDGDFGIAEAFNAAIQVNGSLRVIGNGLLRLGGAYSSIRVEGNALFDGRATDGELAVGDLEIRGDLVQRATISPRSFRPAPGFNVTFIGSGAIDFATPAESFLGTVDHFGNLTRTLRSDVTAQGVVRYDLNGVTVRSDVLGVGGARTFTTHGLDLGGSVTARNVTFRVLDGGPLTLDGGTTFADFDPAVVQLDLVRSSGVVALDFASFTTVPSGTGRYLRAMDTTGVGDGAFTVNVTNVTPAVHGGFAEAAGGAVINGWPAGVALPKLALGDDILHPAGLQVLRRVRFPAPLASDVAVTLRSLDSTIVRVALDDESVGRDSLLLPGFAGDTAVRWVLQGMEGATGSARVVASAPGFEPDTITITMIRPALKLELVTPAQVAAGDTAMPILRLQVGYNDEGTLIPMGLRAHGPGAVFTITSGAPAVSLLRFTETAQTTGAAQTGVASVTFTLRPRWSATQVPDSLAPLTPTLLAEPTGLAGLATFTPSADPEWIQLGASPTLEVIGRRVVLAPDSIGFAATIGDVAPLTADIAVSNASVGRLGGLAAEVLYGAGASDWLAVTFDSTITPTTMHVAATPEFLAAGTWTAHVIVTSTAPATASDTLAVSITVAGANRIVIVSGDGQQVAWGEYAPDSLKVRVLQADGSPLGDSFVQFTVSANGGSVSPTSEVTDENGYVATRWLMSDALGTHTVTVSRAGYQSAVFTGTSLAGTYVTRVAITAGRTSFTSVGDSERFSASAFNLADSLITSKALLWESTDLAVATVDDSGTVTVVGAGTTYIRASVDDGIDSVLVTVTLPLPVGLSIVSGDAQSATVGTALAAPVVIRYVGIGGAPVSGASLRVQGVHGCCNPFLDSTVTTDAAGLASIRPTMPTVASPATFTVSVVGAPTVTSANFTATPLPGAAVALQFSLNTGSGNAGSIIAPGWVVRAMDAFSNTATAFTGPISVALSNGPTGITTLGGTTTRNAVAGVATFNDLTVNVAATSWVLLATSTGLATAGSAAFSIGIPFDFTLVNTPLVALGGTATVRAISGVPAYGAGFVVSLAPSNGAILGVNAPATVTIPPGDSVATWTIVGLSTGTTFLNLTRDGVGAGQISVTVSSNTISVPLILNAPYTRTTSLPINLTQPAPAGGTTLTVTSSDPAIVTVLTPTVTIAAGTLSANAQLEGRTLGEAAVLVSGPALATGVSTVRVTAALDFIESSTSLNANFNTATVRARLLSGGTVFPAPVGGIPLAFVSRDPACVAAPTATSVPAGANTIDVVLEYGGSAATTCSTRIIVSSSSFDSDSVSVTVNPQPTSTLSVTPRIAAGLVRQGTVSLGAASPPGGTLVTLASSDSARLLLSPDAATVGHGTLELTIPPGSFSASFWYAGVEGQGGTTATISGTAARYVAPLARDITIDSLGVEFSGSTSLTTLGGDGGGTVVLGSITGAAGSQSVINESVVRAGGSSYAVSVTSTSPAVAVPVVAGVAAATRVVTIGPGQSRASVGIRPLTSGTTTFQATAPAVISPVRAGYPGTITITQPTTALSVTPRIAAGLVRQGTLSLGAASPPGGTVFTLASSDSTRLLLSPDAETVGHGTLDLTIPAGQFSISFWYAGVEDQGGTTATISGTVPGGLYSAPTPRDITIDTLGVELSGSVSLTTLGGDGSGTAVLGSISTSGTNQSVINESVVRAGGRTYTVTIASTAPAVAIPVVAGTAGASRTVTIAPGQSRAGFGIRPLTSGTTTFTGTAPDVVTPSRVGYPATITITQPITALSVTPRIAAGLVRQGTISLGAASPPGGTVIALTSSDSTRLLLSPDASTVGHGTLDVTIPAGQFSASVWYAGVEDQGGTTATISATVPGGLYSAPAPRDISIDTLGVEASGSTSLTTLGGDGNGTVTLGSISTSGANQSVINESVVRAGGRTYTVTLTSTTPTVAVPVVAAVAASPRIVTIGPGQSRASFGIRPLVAGTTTFTATAPDAVTPVRTGYPATLTVASPSSSISLSPRVGAGLAMQGTVSFAVAIPAGGATVTLTSSDPTRLLVARDFTSAGAAQITIPVNQGQFSTSFVVMGLEDVTGSPTVTAQTAGFTDAIATVAVEPIGVQWSGTSSLTTLAGDGSGTVVVGIITGVAGNRSVSPEQVIRTGGVSRTITLTSSAPSVVLPVVAGVAQQGISVTILPGESRASVGVRPIGAGVATIAPSGAGLVPAETPTVPQTVTVTVPRISLSLSGTTVGSGLAQAGTLSFESGIPVGGLTLTLTSTDSSLLRLAPDGSTAGTGQLVLPLTAGTFSRAITTMALEGVTGSVGITATITGYRDTTFAITVVAPAVALDGPPATRSISAGDIAFQALVGVPVGNGVRQQLVRFGAPAPLTVTLTSSAPTVGTLVIGGVAGSPATLTIPVGQSSTPNVVATRANFRPLTSGNATITATIPGFVQQGDAIRTVTVTP